MLNTIPILKGGNQNDNNNESIIKRMAKETAIEKGIREIEEKTAGETDAGTFFTDPIEKTHINTDIAKSFHSMESKIFGKLNKSGDDETKKIEGFDLSEITKKYSGTKSVDVFSDNKKLMINANEKLNKFTVADKNGQELGYFTVDHIFKYVCQPYDEKGQVLNELDEKIYKRGKDLIKMLVFKVEYNKKDKASNRINILDYNRSGFMSDVELLVKLNEMLYKYNETEANTSLSGLDKIIRAKMEKNFKKLIYLLLNYTLKLIAVLSDKLKDTPNRDNLKKQLLKYSVSLVYRISTFVQEQLQIFNEHNKHMKELLVYNIEVKDEIKNKLDKLLKTIQANNEQPIKPNPLKTAKYYEI